jgi:DNA-binding transcriptional LysR family regulator
MTVGTLRIRDFELIVALHEEGNMTRASARLGISEPALSKQIHKIEQRIKTRLFERGNGGVVTTVPGRAFVAHAIESIQSARRAVHEAYEATHGERHKLRVGISPYLPSSLISTIHSIELPLYRDLSIEIATGYSPELVTDLFKRNIDLALVASPTPNPVMTTLCIAKNTFMIAFRVGHPLAANTFVTLSEILDYPWVFFKRAIHPTLHDLILHRVELEDRQANIVHHGSHVDQASALLNNDSILGWLNPAGVESAVHQGFICVPLLDEHIHLETHLASLADNRSRLVSEFARRFVTCWNEQQPPEQLSLPIG